MPSSRLSIRPPTRRSKSRQKRDNIESSLLGMDQPKKLAGLSRRTWLSATVLFVALVIVSPLVYAARPYFKAFGADVFTGGWFNSGDTICTNSANYQEPITDNNFRGGVMTFSKTDAGGKPRGGTSSQFGALSVGNIDGTVNSSLGFYSSGETGSTNFPNHLSFANYYSSGSMAFGGKLQGTVRQGYCIPDYYGTKSGGAIPGSSTPNLSNASGKYVITPSTGNIVTVVPHGSSATIPAGANITLFVNGNAYIGGNITYSSSSTVG